MNFTFHQLQIFLEVVKERSITKAAEKMHMTQPALSIQLKNFQMQFDIPLTEVMGKKLYVTDFGNSIAEIAEKIIEQADDIRYKSKEYSDLLAGKLRISCASTGKYVIPYFMSGFLEDYPGVDLVLDVSNKSTVVQSLQKNEIDFALVSVVPNKMDINEEILLENKLYLVGSPLHHEQGQRLIYREDGSATRKAMDEYFKGESKRRKMMLTSNEAVKQAIIAGLGQSILPLIGIKNELSNKELEIIPTEGLPMVTNWRLIWLKNKKLSPVAEAFLNFIHNKKYDIIQESFQWYLKFTDKSL
ncbi:LysR substrate-binding domain-containing protein [Sediminitomix flava]|uniref:DNA-binding transcriptional LysR family regulator n=1 Tax=Sediminitomix flava TaxID=379075 RepID=A0A315ZAB9_SEDFL|nr:LysR substrate-binding domain-containing protein [Sediminitomix flava]PWJ41788.1 DNA-binding transcriptional LysR family regulator [Sediminitomix flava]